MCRFLTEAFSASILISPSVQCTKIRFYLIFFIRFLQIELQLQCQVSFYFTLNLTVLHIHWQVVFKTDIYGTFRETLVFDFGSEPVLSRDMQVESAPVTDTEKVLSEIRLSQQGRWQVDQVSVVEYKQKLVFLISLRPTLLILEFCLDKSDIGMNKFS